jgi:hypothetical protein
MEFRIYVKATKTLTIISMEYHPRWVVSADERTCNFERYSNYERNFKKCKERAIMNISSRIKGAL